MVAGLFGLFTFQRAPSARTSKGPVVWLKYKHGRWRSQGAVVTNWRLRRRRAGRAAPVVREIGDWSDGRWRALGQSGTKLRKRIG